MAKKKKKSTGPAFAKRTVDKQSVGNMGKHRTGMKQVKQEPGGKKKRPVGKRMQRTASQ